LESITVAQIITYVYCRWVKKEELPEVYLPAGRETGANEMWVPACFTNHGVVEGGVERGLMCSTFNYVSHAVLQTDIFQRM